MSGFAARRLPAAVGPTAGMPTAGMPIAGLVLAAGIVLASGLLAPAGLAQVPASPASAAPRPLGAPLPLGPPQRAAAPEPGTAISAEPLAPPSPDAAGLLAPTAGGLPEPVWEGTRRAVVERLLPALPGRNPSPTLRMLERRLLLTSAEPPRGDGPSLVALRVAALGAMGATGDAAALAEAASLAGDQRTARLRVRAHLLAGSYHAVCDGVPALSDADALRLTAVCQALDGQVDAALLTAGLLREAGDGDPALVRLLEAVGTGAAAPDPGLAEIDPEHLALLRIAKLPVPAEAFTGELDVLAALAAEPLADPAARLDAAERAATLGLLDPVRLAAAYEAASADTVRGALFARLAAGTSPGDGASLVAEATAGMPVPTLAGPVGALWADALGPVLVAAEVRPAAAGQVARLLLAQDRGAEAEPWLASLDAADAAALGPASVAVGIRTADAGLDAWLDRATSGDGAARHRAAGVLAVLRAGGAAIPDRAWLALLDPARVPREVASPALLQWLRDAALTGAIGETVLVALVLMGEDAPADAAPATVAAVVEALRAVGLDEEARRIAVEAVLPPAG